RHGYIPRSARLVEKDRLFDSSRVEAVANQVDLAILERARRLHHRLHADEERARIAGQFAAGVVGRRPQGGACPGRDRRHAGAAVELVDLDAIDDGLVDPRIARDHLRDFGRGDVFALPAEGVADTVDEIEIALRILAHEVAGAEPGVAPL